MVEAIHLNFRELADEIESCLSALLKNILMCDYCADLFLYLLLLSFFFKLFSLGNDKEKIEHDRLT